MMFLRNYYTASILLMVVLLTYNNIMNINNCSFLLESDRISYVLVCIQHSTYLYMVCRINIVLYNYIMKPFVCLPISSFSLVKKLMLLLGCSWAQKLIISVYNAIVWNILMTIIVFTQFYARILTCLIY